MAPIDAMHQSLRHYNHNQASKSFIRTKSADARLDAARLVATDPARGNNSLELNSTFSELLNESRKGHSCV